MKLDAFTIFLILLGVLVVITISMNWFKRSKETFVNFQNEPATGTSVYIPQYSKDKNRKVSSIHDNIYFDKLNGALIEVFAPPCTSSCDTTGKEITAISVIDREGGEESNLVATKTNGVIDTYNSSQSYIQTVEPAYSHFLFTSQCDNTRKYQVVYTSWNTNTYISVIDLSANKDRGTLVKSVYSNSNGIVDTQTTFQNSIFATYSPSAVTLSVNKSTLPKKTDPRYLSGAELLELGNVDGTNSILYDCSNGYIIFKKDTEKTIYDRKGVTITDPKVDSFVAIEPTNTCVLNNNNMAGISVLVTAKGVNTVISILKTGTVKYELLNTFRFNQAGLVIQSSESNPTPTPSSGGNNDPNRVDDNSRITTPPSSGSNVCGDDLSCKWYWYFNTIAQKNGNKDTYFSDDYFLKTEAVPPVCPQCPQCPSGGACSNCGGNGGGGCSSTASPAPKETTKPRALPPGAVRDSSGNTYVPYKDANGSTRYVKYTTYDGEGEEGGPAGGPGGMPKNFTYVDKDGQFVTTADPDTLGGGLALSTFSFDQLGTSAFNNIGGVANNVVSTTGNAFGSVTDLAGGVVGTAADLVKGAGSGAVGLARDFGSGVANLGANDNRWNSGIGRELTRESGAGGPSGRPSGGGSAGSSLGYTPFGSVSAKSFGNMPGKTPVDNYSAYGALQSKGGNYMPVTADFSAFRK